MFTNLVSNGLRACFKVQFEAIINLSKVPSLKGTVQDAGNLGDACDAGKSRSVVITGVFCSIQ